MSPRPMHLDKRFGWCRRAHHGVFFDRSKGCPECLTQARRTRDGKCNARLGHGPGHQGRTYCEVEGPHKVHECHYGSGRDHARWTGPVNRIKYTGFFDEPPEIKDDI